MRYFNLTAMYCTRHSERILMYTIVIECWLEIRSHVVSFLNGSANIAVVIRSHAIQSLVRHKGEHKLHRQK